MLSSIVSTVRKEIAVRKRSIHFRSTNALRGEKGNSFTKAVNFCLRLLVPGEKRKNIDTTALVY